MLRVPGDVLAQVLLLEELLSTLGAVVFRLLGALVEAANVTVQAVLTLDLHRAEGTSARNSIGERVINTGVMGVTGLRT